MVDENSVVPNFQVQTIVLEAYVTGVEVWTQLVYKQGPTYDIRNAICNWCRNMDPTSVKAGTHI